MSKKNPLYRLNELSARRASSDANDMREVVNGFKRLIQSYRDAFRDEPFTCSSGDPEIEAVYCALCHIESQGFDFGREIDGRRTDATNEQKKKWANAPLPKWAMNKIEEKVEEKLARKSRGKTVITKNDILKAVIGELKKEVEKLERDYDKKLKELEWDDEKKVKELELDYEKKALRAIVSKRKVEEAIDSRLSSTLSE